MPATGSGLHRQFLAGAMLILAGLWWLAWLGDMRQQIDQFMLICLVVATGYLLAVHNPPSPDQTNDRRLFRYIVGAAILFRLLLAGSYPFLTDDIYRYVWDGHVAAHGINPYQYAPSDIALTELRDEKIFPNINHPDVPTIYAPVLQAIFLAAYLISPGFTALKLILLLFDIGVILLIAALLRQRGSSPLPALIYGWHPLVLVEIAGSAHIDVVGVFFLLLALWLLRASRPIFAGIAFACSMLTKFIPLILLPYLFLRHRKMMWRFLPAMLLMVIAGYLPFWGAGEKLIEALFVYAGKWRYNDSLFALTYAFLHAGMPDFAVASYIRSFNMTPIPEAMLSMRVDLVLVTAKATMAALWGAGALWLLWRTWAEGRRADVLAIWGGLFGGLCMISPTFHPWYLVWLLPVCCFYVRWSWIVLGISLLLSYEIISGYAATGVWQENTWIKLAIFVPFYGLLWREWRSGAYRWLSRSPSQ